LKVGKSDQGVGRTQLFIAYLYKPEAQAKVLQIPVYYSHIIPSLALQACKTIDTLRVGFYIRRSLWTKERGPFDKLRDRSSIRSVSLPNCPLKLRDRSSSQIMGIQKDKQQKE
jgi:hypothetical protein